MKMKFRPCLSAASLALIGIALGGCTTEPTVALDTTAPAAGADVAPSSTAAMGAAGSLSAADRDFATRAAISEMMEIGTSEVALQHSTNPQVISYAQAMIQQHTAANNDLAAIMQAGGVRPPTALPPRQVDEMTDYAMRFEDFDNYYVDHAGVQAHQDAIAVLQQRMPALADPALKQWAANELPVLQQQLSVAQDIDQRLPG